MDKITQSDIVNAIKKKFGFEHVPGQPQSITLISLQELIPGSTIKEIGEVIQEWKDVKRVDTGLSPAAIEIPGVYFNEETRTDQASGE